MPTQINYSIACPQCGSPMSLVMAGPESAPWVCQHCYISFWPCELTNEARIGWANGALTWQHRVSVTLSEVRNKDIEAAMKRSTSVLPEHLQLLSRSQLIELQKNLPTTGFISEVEKEISIRKAS